MNNSIFVKPGTDNQNILALFANTESAVNKLSQKKVTVNSVDLSVYATPTLWVNGAEYISAFSDVGIEFATYYWKGSKRYLQSTKKLCGCRIAWQE